MKLFNIDIALKWNQNIKLKQNVFKIPMFGFMFEIDEASIYYTVYTEHQSTQYYIDSNLAVTLKTYHYDPTDETKCNCKYLR